MADEQTTNSVRKDARKRFLRAVGLLLMLALAAWLRILFAANTEVIQPIGGDAKQYVSYATNLRHAGVYSRDEGPPIKPDSFRSPGYPAFLSLMMALGDQWYRATLGCQAALGMLTVLATYLIARTFLPGAAVWCATALTAVSPHLLSTGTYLLTETLFCFSLAVSLLLFMVADGRKSPWWFAASGIAFGVTYFINESTLLLPFLLIAIRALAMRRPANDASKLGTSRWAGVAPFMVAFMLFPAIWMSRNKIADIEPERLGSRRAVATISHGSYPNYIHQSPRYQYYPYREDPEQPAYGQSLSNFWPIFTRRVSARPVRYLFWYTVEKPFFHFWGWNILQGQGDVFIYPVRSSPFRGSLAADCLRQLMKLAHPLVVATAIFGVLVSLRGRILLPDAESGLPMLAIATCLIYFTFLYGCVFAGWPRYAIPLRPELYLASLYGVSWAFITTKQGLATRALRE